MFNFFFFNHTKEKACKLKRAMLILKVIQVKFSLSINKEKLLLHSPQFSIWCGFSINVSFFDAVL